MPSGWPQELDLAHADDARRLDLLGLAHGAALVGVQAVDARLAARHHAVDDLLALGGPARHRGGRSELQVVGVRHDAQGALPVLGQWFEGRALVSHVPEHPAIGWRRPVPICSDGCMEIREIDVHDEALLRAWFDAEGAAIAHDRPHAVRRTLDALVTQVAVPSDYCEGHLLAAVRRTTILGIAELGYSLQDNPHLADLEVTVRPEHRRRGIGRALYGEATTRRREAGRTSACGEIIVVEDDGRSRSPGRWVGSRCTRRTT